MAAPAPPLQVPSSAPVKFLSLSTNSMKAADAAILQTSNNIPWHLDSELSLLSSFTLRVCGLVEEVLRCHLASMNGQHWERASLARWECFCLSSGSVLVLQKAAAALISPR